MTIGDDGKRTRNYLGLITWLIVLLGGLGLTQEAYQMYAAIAIALSGIVGAINEALQ